MKKIMFNDKYGLTKAVLEGRKTQTRRIANITQHQFELLTGVHPKGPKKLIQSILDTTSRFKVGEIVAVAQSYKNLGYSPEAPLQEEAGYYPKIKYCLGYTNKMFVRAELMPSQIRITKVRIQRLQDISDEDCLKEGIEFDGKAQSFYCGFETSKNSKIWLGSTPHEAYAVLIDKVSGKGTWERNPYVFVYDLELVK